MGKVHNKRDGSAPAGAVYVGRPTPWGNPFTHKHGTLARHVLGSAEEAVAAYKAYLWDNAALLARLPELADRDLVCWCKPGPCHGDVLLHAADWAKRRPDLLAERIATLNAQKGA